MHGRTSSLIATVAALATALALILPAATDARTGRRHPAAHHARTHVRRHARHHSRSHHHAPAKTRGTRAAAGTGATGTQAPAEAIAAALAKVCENTELQPEAGNVALVQAAVLCLINHERAAHGENPLALNPELERAAEEHSQELVADDYFAHVSPSGVTPEQRVRQDGYIPSATAGYVVGENLAWGTYGLATAKSIVAAWVASPGHLANILEARYSDTGLGIVAAVPHSLGEGAPGATYAQEFGAILE